METVPGRTLRRGAPLVLLAAILHLPLMGIDACTTPEDDLDGDGYTTAEGDCDDLDSSAYPGALELCDDRDNNCNSTRDEGLSCAGYITTVAGNGLSGYAGDGDLAYHGRMAIPYGVAADATGTYYVADTSNHRVRRVGPDGVITTIAGTGTAGYSGDGGAATAALLNHPEGVATDGSGNVYIADTYNAVIRRVSAAGTISTVAGNGTAGFGGDGGAATAAKLALPRGVALYAGDLYIADTNNHRVRRVSGGTITTVAGNGTGGYGGDGGQATAASMLLPSRAVFDGAGAMFIADSGNHRVRRVSGGLMSTVAGNGKQGFAGDGGPATAAQLDEPDGVWRDAGGSIFIADTGNNRVRRVAGDGTISTVAGTGGGGYGGDTGPATEARIDYPEDVSIDSRGNLLIVDSANSAIRLVFRAW